MSLQLGIFRFEVDVILGSTNLDLDVCVQGIHEEAEAMARLTDLDARRRTVFARLLPRHFRCCSDVVRITRQQVQVTISINELMSFL